MLKHKKYNPGCMVLSPLFHKGIMACAFFLLLGAGIFLPARFSFAADITWAGTTSGDWAVASNWSTGAVPTSADNVTIPDAGTTANDPAIAAGASCNNLTIAASGVLDGNAQTITVYGNWTNGGTFNHGSGKVVFAGNTHKTFVPGGSTYFDLELNRGDGYILTVSGTATVTGNINQINGSFGGGQLDLAGNYIIGAGSDGAPYSAYSTVINLNGTLDQQIVYSAGGVGGQVRIDKAGGTVPIVDNIVVNGWSYIQGAVTGLDIHTLVFGDNYNGTFAPGALTYSNIELKKTGYDTLVVSGTGTISGNLTHTSGELMGGQLDLAGNYIVGASATGGSIYGASTVINFNHATNDQTLVYSAGGTGAQIRIDKEGGTFAVNDNIVICGWTYVQGTVTGLDIHTLVFGDNYHGSFTPGGLVYGDIELNKGGYDNLIVNGTATISGNVIHTQGQFGGGQLNVAGDYLIGAAADGGADSTVSTIVNLNGTGDQAISYAADGNGTAVRIDKVSGTLTVPSSLSVSGWNYVQGTVSGISTCALRLGGVFNNSFTPGSLTYDDIEIRENGSYTNFTISGNLSANGNLTLTAGTLRLNTNNPSLNFGGDFTIAAGTTVSAGTNPITVSGNWTNNGTFNHGGGKIVFAGSSEKTFTPGSSQYFNLELNRSAILVVSGTAGVAGDYTHTRGQMRNGQFDVAGDYIIGASAGGAAYTSTVINLNSSADQQIVYTPGGSGAQLRIDKPAGTLVISSDIVVNGWNYIQGTVTGLDTHTLIFGDDEYGTFTPGSLAYNNIELSKTGTDMLITSGTASIAGNFTHTDGQMREGQFNLAGNYIIGALAGGAAYGSTIINFNSSADQQVVYSAGGVGARIRIDKPAGTFTISDNIVINGWVYVQGTVVGLDAYTLIFGDDEYGEFVPGSLVYGNIELNKTGTDSLITTGTATIAGNFTHTDGQLRYGQLNVAGNYIIGAAANGATYTSTIVNLNSSANQQVIYAAGGCGGWVRIDKPAGTLSILNDITVSGWSHIQGTVAGIDTYTLTFGDSEYGEFEPGSLTYKNIVINKTGTDDLYVGAGTLNISGNLTVTDGDLRMNTNNPTVNISGDVSIASAGFIYAGTNLMTVNGNWTNGGTFSHGNGKIIFAGSANKTFTPGSSTYNDIEVNKTNHYGVYDNLAVTGTATLVGDFIHTEGEIAGGQIDLTVGDYVIPATADGGQWSYTVTVINFNGAGNQSVLYTAGGIGGHIRVDKASGTLSIPNGVMVDCWTYVRGTISGLDAHPLAFGDMYVGSFTPGDFIYTDIEINKTDESGNCDDLNISGTASVAGNIIQTNGDFLNGQIDLAGDYLITSGSDGSGYGHSPNTATIVNLNGDGDQQIISEAGGRGTTVRIDKTSGTVSIVNDLTVNGWIYVQGSVIGLDQYTLTLGDDFYGTFTPGGLAYGNITMNKTNSNGDWGDLVVSGGTIDIQGDLVLIDGEFRLSTNSPSIELTGSLSIGSAAYFTRGTGTITFIGTAPSVFTDSSATPQNLGSVVLGKTNADPAQNVLTLASAMTCSILAVNSDNTLDLGTGGHVFALANVGNTANVLVLNGTLNEGDGTVRYAATNSAGSINLADTDYNSLELGGAETYVLTADADLGGDLSIGASSTLDSATFDITLAGDFTDSGTFIAGSNLVTLDGTNQSLSGTTSFYDLTKTVAAADTLVFQSGATTSVTHALTLRGASRDNRLTLQSSVPDSLWNLAVDPLASYDFDALAVSDSVASRPLASLNSLDQGGNTNWSLTSNTAPSITAASASSGGDIATITATLSDIDADNLTLKIEYSLDGGATWLDPYLDSVTASSGAPVLSNANEYQLSGISTASNNTLSILWDTTSESNQGGMIEYADNVKVRLSPYDGTDYGTSQISSVFTVDNRASVSILPAKPDLSDLKITQEDGILRFEHLPKGIAQVAISASPDFADASFGDISAAVDISGYASDTLYLKFRTKRGAVSDAIIYERNSGTISQLLEEGDIVKAPDSFDVYIIKYKNNKQYKRLILSPSVFASYGHLKWENLKTVTQIQLDSYSTTGLVQVAGDSSLYELTPLGDTGKRRLVGSIESYDRDSVYEINKTDRDSYRLED